MRKFKPVKTKKDFTKRYAAGEFGNASPTWHSLSSFLRDNPEAESVYQPLSPQPLFHIRNRVAGAATWYDIPLTMVKHQWHNVINSGEAKPTELYISAMAPTSHTTIQGELMMTPRGLEIYGTTVKKPMRDALREKSETFRPIEVRAIRSTFMDPGSNEWIEILLERYPDHVIEFSCYSKCWGTVPHRNTVIWEVRQY